MKTPTTQPDEFLTGDLGQAALVVANDVPLLEVRSKGRHAVFVFPATAEPLARKFFQPGKDLVSARKFHMALRDLRGLAREATKEWEGR